MTDIAPAILLCAPSQRGERAEIGAKFLVFVHLETNTLNLQILGALKKEFHTISAGS